MDQKKNFLVICGLDRLQEELKKEFNGVKELIFFSSGKYDIERIDREYPDFGELDQDQKDKIFDEMQIIEKLDLKSCNDLQSIILEDTISLVLKGFEIDGNNINELINTANLKKVKLENVQIDGNVGEVPSNKEIIINKVTLKNSLKSVNMQSLENILVEVESIQEIEQIYNHIGNLTDKKINFKLNVDNISEVTLEALEKLSEKSRIAIKTDLRDHYNISEIKEIIQKMKLIKKLIPKDANEFEKFMTVYCILSNYMDYDASGNGDVKYEEKIRTRSLYEGIINGRACCQGYALTLTQVLDYVGIEAKIIGGEVGKFEEGDIEKEEALRHAWNIVKINGKYYNCDLTSDYKFVRNGNMPQYCLRNNDYFYENLTPDDSAKIEEAEADFDQKLVGKFVRNNRRKRREVGKEDFKENSKRTTIKNIMQKMKVVVRKEKRKRR